LSHNETNKVISYNITDDIQNNRHKIYSKQNIEFRIKNVLDDLTEEFISNCRLIVIDIDHFESNERLIIDKLYKLNFSGIILLDDIIHPDPYTYSCMQRLWNNIEFNKLELTKYAHFSGTGCVFMNTNINIVIDEYNNIVNKNSRLDLWQHNSIDKLYNFPVSKNWFCNSELKQHIQSNMDLDKVYKVLEIGSFEGCSSCFISDILLNNVSSSLICVDPFISDGCEKVHSSTELKQRFYDNIQKSSNYNKIIIEEKFSDDFFISYKGDLFNFIYIDGEHSDKQINNDLENALKLLEINGICWCDDYNNKWKDIFVKWISENNDYIQIIHQNYQLGFIKIK
jgi:predicted O-methyltransferase YrrM